MPKISVIIPCYNVQDYISVCLDSIISNSFTDLEIICVDDKSTDNTLSIIQQYAATDSRIKIINLSKNSGVAVARNTGLHASTCDWVSFIDPDDYIDSNFYDALYKHTKNDFDVIKAGTIIHDLKTGQISQSSTNRRILKHRFYFACEHWSALYNKNFLLKHRIDYPSDIITGQDDCFLANVVLHTNRIFVTNDTNYHYNYNRPGSLDSEHINSAKIASKIKTLNYKMDLFKHHDFASAYEQQLFLRHQIMGNHQYLTNRNNDPQLKTMLFNWLAKNQDSIGHKVLRQYFDNHQIKAIKNNNIDSFMQSPKTYRIFYKERIDNCRKIYIFGKHIFTYYKS